MLYGEKLRARVFYKLAVARVRQHSGKLEDYQKGRAVLDGYSWDVREYNKVLRYLEEYTGYTYDALA